MSNLFSILVKPEQYLDPAGGGLIVQIVLASVMGAGVAIGVFWKNIKAFFTGKKAADQEIDPTEIDPTEIEETAEDAEEVIESIEEVVEETQDQHRL